MHTSLKIFVFSDSHGRLTPMMEAIRGGRPDRIFHLGDCVPDAEAVKQEFPEIPMENVPGNCDYGAAGPVTKVMELEGKRILMTHGHRYGVKSGYLRAVYAAKEQQAAILLFGHTHRAECFQEEGVWVLNPGAALMGSYGIIILEKGQIQCCLAPDTERNEHYAAYH